MSDEDSFHSVSNNYVNMKICYHSLLGRTMIEQFNQLIKLENLMKSRAWKDSLKTTLYIIICYYNIFIRKLNEAHHCYVPNYKRFASQ